MITKEELEKLSPEEKIKARKEIADTLISTASILAKALGWHIAFPAGGGPKDHGKLSGIVIGEEAYLKYLFSHVDDSEEYYFAKA